MNKLVEKFGKNELLDAEWYCTIFGKSVEDISLSDALGPFGGINPVGQLYFGKYRLLLLYDKRGNGLHNFFSSDERVANYIKRDIDAAFYDAIKGYSDYVYVLNIASVENFGAFEWKNAKDILDRQLRIFMPIIQKFMVDALTDNIKKQE